MVYWVLFVESANRKKLCWMVAWLLIRVDTSQVQWFTTGVLQHAWNRPWEERIERTRMNLWWIQSVKHADAFGHLYTRQRALAFYQLATENMGVGLSFASQYLFWLLTCTYHTHAPINFNLISGTVFQHGLPRNHSRSTTPIIHCGCVLGTIQTPPMKVQLCCNTRCQM